MKRHVPDRRSGLSTRVRRCRLIVALALAGALAGLSSQPAMAGLQKEFAVFANCPVNAPGVSTCIYSETTGGQFKIGNETVPINKPVILQGGLTQGSEELVGATDGNTLSKTKLVVPGIELLGQQAESTAELAGPVKVNTVAVLKGEGTGVELPLKLKLESAILGDSCYIGSSRHPVVPHLTTGTSTPPAGFAPLTGSPGTLEIVGAGKIDRVTGSSLVDNDFAVPGASGCGGILFELIDDPIVDLIVGVPAPAGVNQAILDGTLEQASAAAVKDEAVLPEIGRCVKVPGEKVEGTTVYHGGYEDSGCTTVSAGALGKFEWEPGVAGSKAFSGEGKTATLQTVGEAKVICTASHNSGEYTSTKTATISITFTGCVRKLNQAPCQTPGAASGEVRMQSLQVKLGFIKDLAGEPASVGWDVYREPALVSAECGASKEAFAITGSVIGSVPVDKMLASQLVKFKQSLGKQEIQSFEEQPKDTLSVKFGAQNPEEAGLTTAEKVVNPEKLEVKAVSN